MLSELLPQWPLFALKIFWQGCSSILEMSSFFREHPLRVVLPQLRVLHPSTCPAGTYGTWGSAGPGRAPLNAATSAADQSGINERLKAVQFTPARWQTAVGTKGVWEEHHIKIIAGKRSREKDEAVQNMLSDPSHLLQTRCQMQSHYSFKSSTAWWFCIKCKTVM